MIKNLKYFLLSIIFGILATASLEPFSIPLVRWIPLGIVFYIAQELKKESLKFILLISFLLSLILCIFAFHWIIYLFVEYGGISYFLSVLIFLPYSILLNSKIPLILIFLAKIKYKYKIFYKYNFILIPLIITIIDIITPQVFNWYWGNLVTKNILFSQIADIVGIHGLTFLFIFFSYSFYRVFRIAKKNISIIFHNRFRKIYLWIFVLFIIIHIYGIYQIVKYKEIIKNSEKIRVGIIQPNAPLEKYGENKVTSTVLENLMLKEIPSLAQLAYEKGEEKIDLFVLPESAIPYYTTQKNSFTLRYNAYHPYFEFLIHQINAKYNAEVFFNEFFYEIKENRRLLTYNSSSLFSRKGQREATYHKRKLIAFGEQIPLAEFLDSTGLIKLVPESIRYSRFEPGNEFTAIPYQISNIFREKKEPENFFFDPIEEITNYKKIQEFFMDRNFNVSGYFMPLICYEIIQPEYIRKFYNNSKKNLDFIVNITQDKWYGNSIESYQHLELAKIRSIEFRTSIIRSTNSGVSTSIDPTGNYIQPIYGNILTNLDQKEVQVTEIPIIKNNRTIYSYIGTNWLYLIIIIYIILIFYNEFNKKYRN